MLDVRPVEEAVMNINRNKLVSVIMLLSGLLLFLVGCPQGEDPAEAMAREFNARQAAKGGASKDTAMDVAAGKPAVDPALAAGAQANPCNPCETPAEEEYTGPIVTILIESIDNGIPEYEGKAKYDIKLEVQSDEVPATPGVWEIKAFDENGELVGESKKHLTIPSSYPKILALNGFYCSMAPVSFEIRRTNGEAISVEDALAASDSGKGGKGNSRGAGGGNDAAGGRGAAGGAGGGGGGDDEGDDPVPDE